MALMMDNMRVVGGGDPAFYRCDTFRSAHDLPAGTVAEAENCRFEDGRAWPRHGLNEQGWGRRVVSRLPRTTTLYSVYTPTWTGIGSPPWYYSAAITGLTAGRTYLVTLGNAQKLVARDEFNAPAVAANGRLVATQSTYYFYRPYGGYFAGIVDGFLDELAADTPCGFARFNDPQAYDTAILVTNAWREAAGEDGGRGRAWRIQSGNTPQEIPLNGHDVWDTTRIIPCYNGIVLLRQGNERHYFSAELDLDIVDADATADTVAADTAALVNGYPVNVTGITGASGTYYARVVSATALALYDTAAHAAAGGSTGLFDVTVASETGTLTRLAVDPADASLRLNTTPDWADGDRVTLYCDPNSEFIGANPGDTPPQNNTRYYVKRIADTIWQLYSNSALTTALVFQTARGRFW